MKQEVGQYRERNLRTENVWRTLEEHLYESNTTSLAPEFNAVVSNRAVVAYQTLLESRTLFSKTPDAL